MSKSRDRAQYQAIKWRGLMRLVDEGRMEPPEEISGIDNWRLLAEQAEFIAEAEDDHATIVS